MSWKAQNLLLQWWLTESEAVGQAGESPSGSRWNMRKGLNGNRSSGPAAQTQQIIWLKQLWKGNCCTAAWWEAETARRLKAVGKRKLLVPCSCPNMEGGEEGRSRRTETGQKNSSGLWQKGSRLETLDWVRRRCSGHGASRASSHNSSVGDNDVALQITCTIQAKGINKA